MSDKQLALLLANISRNVKTARKAIKLSQEKLALEAGIDRTYVSQIERGVCNPSLEVLTKVAKVLGVMNRPGNHGGCLVKVTRLIPTA